MHGDFTPWNLRSSRTRALSLVDWEDAGWGPPDADEVLYRAVSAALTRPPVTGLRRLRRSGRLLDERVAGRLASGVGEVDRAFGQRLLEVLAG